MSTFKTGTEIASQDTLIQVLEELKSGSLAGGDGVNRLLERLAVNTDVLFAAVQSTANSVLTGGGTWSYVGTTLTWSNAAQIRWAEPNAAVHYNAIAAANVVLADNGGVAYVVLDRVTDGAPVVVQYAASMSALRAAMVATQTRADFVIVAYRSGSTVIFGDGLRLRQNYTLTLERATDNQYAQQSEFAPVQRRQGQNHNLRLVGGGTMTWAVGAPDGVWAWGSDLHVMVSGPDPAAGTNQASSADIAAANVTLAPGELVYINLSTRNPGTGGVGAGVAGAPLIKAYAGGGGFSSLTDLKDKLIIAYHHATDSRLYLMNGQSLGDGDTAVLGGAAAGLQWRYADVGPVLGDEQLLDFGNTYPIGTGALMVFRNGIKQKASSAVWSGGWPGGALTGPVSFLDDYVEYNDGTGNGTSILWLRDIDAADADADELTAGLYRWATVDPGGGIVDGSYNDPPRAWPNDFDFIEAFIGIQGQGPSPVESVGIMGGAVLDRLDGHVELEGGTGIALTYQAGRIRIAVDVAGPAVTSIDVVGGVSPPTAGVFLFAAGAGFNIDDSVAGTLVFELAAALSDLAGVSADLEAAVLAAHTPTSTNAVLTADATPPLHGLDVVWSASTNIVRTAGGGLNRGGRTTLHKDTSTAPVLFAVAPADDYGSVPLVNNWIYAYVGHGTPPSTEPVLVWSLDAPDRSVGFGHHPASVDYAFLASAWFDGTASIYPFVKCGGQVTLGRELSVSSAFSAAIGAPSGGFAWQTIVVPLPSTAGAVARFRMRIQAADPATDRGNLMPLYVRPTGSAAGNRRFSSVMGLVRTEESGRVAETHVEFTFEAVLDDTGSFDISVPSTIYTGAPDVYLVGYDEPTASAAANARSA